VASAGGPGDYRSPALLPITDNAAPATNALAAGHLHDFLAFHPYMGSFSLFVRAPVVAAAHAGGLTDLATYRLGSAVCLLGVALLALWIAQLMASRGHSLARRLLVVALLVVNPMTIDAIWLGHPEEPLAAALCVAAALAVAGRRFWIGGMLLGLAIATKQWAIVAVLPVALMAPAGRLRVAVTAGAVATALALPLAAGDPGRLSTIANEASQTLRAPATSPWAPFATAHRAAYYLGGNVFKVTTTYWLPDSVGRLPRPLIIVTTAFLAVLFWRRRQRSGEPVLGLLALCFLLRAVLDPISPGYYYAPFLIALTAWEGLDTRRVPALGVSCAGTLWLLFETSHDVEALTHERPLVTALYVVWALAATSVIARRVYERRPPLPRNVAEQLADGTGGAA
jgi:Glycosyltransferase family 87